MNVCDSKKTRHVKLSILLSTVIHLTNIYHFHKAINGSTEGPNGQHFSNTVSEKQSMLCFEFLGKLAKRELAVAVPGQDYSSIVV